MMTPSEIRLALLRNGYSPIPVAGKVPPLKEWEKRTETNPDEIRLWGNLYKYAQNTGVLTQRTPAIDIDVCHQPAAEALEDLARNLFSDEGTFLVRIGRAPKRAIPFRTDAPFKKITREYIDQSGEVHKVEILGAGQQVVVNGVHPETQRAYAWTPASPVEVSRDDLPILTETTALAFVEKAEKILAEHGITPLKADKKKNTGDKGEERQPVDWRAYAEAILTGASYHDPLASLSSSAAALGVPKHITKGVLGALLDCSRPPSLEREERRNVEKWKLESTIRSAYKKFGTTESAPEAPIPLFPPLPPAKPYPVEALGPVLASGAAAIARKIQVPVALAAQSVLGAAALVAQAHADVLLPFGQKRPLSMFLCTVAASGDRKSSADSEALWPVRKRERAMKETYDREIVQHRADLAAWNAEKRQIENDKSIDFHTRRSRLTALGDAPHPPLFPFLTAGDPTIEGLVKAWPDAPAALGVFSAEGGQFIGGHGLRAEQALKSAAAFSELWDGLAIKRVRALDGVSVLYGRRLAIHLLVQPDAAAKFLADPVLRDQGLLSRILVAAPDSIAGSRLYRDATQEDESAIRRLGARLLSIAEHAWPLKDGRNELEPRPLAFSEGARKAWIELFDAVEREMGPDCKYRPIGDFGAKAAEHAARIAGVMAIVDSTLATEISQDSMENAIVLARWYLNEAARLQQGARTDPKLLAADATLKFIQSRGDVEIQVRELMQFGPVAIRTKAAAQEVVDILLAHGWIVEVSKRPHTIGLRHAESGEENVASVAA